MNDKFQEYKINEAREDYIPLNKCKKGFLYKIHSRNLSYGIFNGDDGFIGIREKFGQKYLFPEYHYQTEKFKGYGTVKPFVEICELPKEIPCNEYEINEYGSSDWAKDPISGNFRPVLRRDLKDGEPPHGKRHGFIDEWADTKERLPDNLYPFIKGNDKLFKWLQTYEIGN